MAENYKHLELIQRAQRGCKASLDQLAADAAVRLRVHVYRLTLSEDLTQDIVQESILEMIRIIGKLKSADKFWPWLYGIAQNKLHRYWRSEKKNDPKRIEQAGFGGVDDKRREGLENLLADELRQSVSRAMGMIKPRHRQVLAMRCYDGMSYDEISDVLGCSKFAAQMLFCRAKSSLSKQLSKQGLGRGSLMLGLVIFGKMTSESSAAAAGLTISSASLGASAVAAGVSVMTSIKSAFITAAAAGVIAAGTVMNSTQGIDESQAVQIEDNPAITIPIDKQEDSRHQCWYYFPEGGNKAMMTRRLEADSKGNFFCSILQNQHANYRYNNDTRTITMVNSNWYSPDFSVRRLPGDAPSLTAFFTKTEGFTDNGTNIEYVPGIGRNLLVIANHDPDSRLDRASIIRHKNALEEEYFQYPWPSDARKVDMRDQMHKRGWTYFKMTGQMGNNRITGQGVIPFVYSVLQKRPAFIDIYVGRIRLIDAHSGSAILNNKSVIASGGAGALLNGMPRPWMGLHCIDSVRRDAAYLRIPFKTKLLNDNTAEISVGYSDCKLIYSIDLRRDLIDSIGIVTGEIKGKINLEYFQDPGGFDNKFSAPGILTANGTEIENNMIWLWDLAKGTLAN